MALLHGRQGPAHARRCAVLAGDLSWLQSSYFGITFVCAALLLIDHDKDGGPCWLPAPWQTRNHGPAQRFPTSPAAPRHAEPVEMRCARPSNPSSQRALLSHPFRTFPAAPFPIRAIRLWACGSALDVRTPPRVGRFGGVGFGGWESTARQTHPTYVGNGAPPCNVPTVTSSPTHPSASRCG